MWASAWRAHLKAAANRVEAPPVYGHLSKADGQAGYLLDLSVAELFTWTQSQPGLMARLFGSVELRKWLLVNVGSGLDPG